MKTRKRHFKIAVMFVSMGTAYRKVITEDITAATPAGAVHHALQYVTGAAREHLRSISIDETTTEKENGS